MIARDLESDLDLDAGVGHENRMLGRLSRLTPTMRSLVRKQSGQINVARQSSGAQWFYREINDKTPRKTLVLAEGLMAIAWYWVLFHIWYDGAHLTGHFAYPDPSQWTDEQLGIPPDEED